MSFFCFFPVFFCAFPPFSTAAAFSNASRDHADRLEEKRKKREDENTFPRDSGCAHISRPFPVGAEGVGFPRPIGIKEIPSSYSSSGISFK